MKTSNILIGAFVAVSVIATGITVSKVIGRIGDYKHKVEAATGGHQNMKKYTLSACQSLMASGSSEMNVVVRTTNSTSTSVWVEGTWKDSVKVTDANGLLTIESLIKNDQAIAMVIVELPQLQKLTLRNANCTIESLSAKTLDVELLGNSDINIIKGSVETLSYVGKDNSSGDAGDSLTVKAWNIHLTGNANLDGVSPNSKLSMAVTENANVNLKSKRN
jgi:hypothetical protein